ncbi:hypothetical protein IWW36_002824, partial [Coemansia brasiliensis]
MATQFGYLPDVVLQTIYRYCPLSLFDFIGDWKAKLIMPSVCQQWRYATERQLYKNAFISNPAFSLFDSNMQSPLDKEPPVTNVALIIANGKTNMVKSLCIDWNFCDFELAIRDIIGIMEIHDGNSNTGWTNISELQILLYPKATEINTDPLNIISEPSLLLDAANSRAELTNIFINSLTNITKLTLHLQTPNSHACAFFSALASAYIQQLCELKSSEKLRFEASAQIFSDKLSTLYTVINDGSKPVPLIHANSIEDMILSNLPRDFELSQYVYTPDNSEIVFTNLKCMELLLAQDLWQNHLPSSLPTAKVYFPKLERLTVRGCLDSNRAMFGNIVGSSDLKLLTFTGAFSVLKEICKMSMSNVETLTITLEAGNIFDASEFARVTNTLFAHNKESNMSTLTLSQCAFDLDSY